MVLKADGTKWACQSCLKGHRVSGCTHTDRELLLVPKKGRPITQCQHCRLERKKRSAHVKCDCGESEKPHHPKEKCIHLREAEEKARAGLTEGHEEPEDDHAAHMAAVAEEQGCCCHHGGNCACAALKKESDKDGVEPLPHGPVVKPRLDTTKSDGSITAFQNGHHKLLHRKNNAAHDHGKPYRLPLPRSHPHQGVSKTARRSVDSLALDSAKSLNTSDFLQSTNGPSPITRQPSSSGQHSPSSDPSEHHLPQVHKHQLAGVEAYPLEQTWSNLSTPPQGSDGSNFQPLESMSGTAEVQFDPWSAFPSSDSGGMPNNNPFGVWPTNIDNAQFGQPALTAASSGTTSEIDDIPPMDETYGFSMPIIQEDVGTFDFNNAAGLTSPSNRRSLPPNFFSSSDFALPTTDADWQTAPLGDMMDQSSTAKSFADVRQGSYDEGWQMQTYPTTVNDLDHSMDGTTFAKRPGPRTMSDDIMQQLFPGLGANGSMFGPAKGIQDLPIGSDNFMNSGNHTSAPLELGPMDDINELTKQSWTANSMNAPLNDFSPSNHVSAQDFSMTGFDYRWAQ